MIQYVVLAIIQGLTEFLPVSSSGHLVIFNKLFGLQADIFFYLVLHLGTMFSLVAFFFKDIVKILKNIDYLKKIAIVTFTTGILGFLGKDFLESLFSNYIFVLGALSINGIILIVANKFINTLRKPKPGYLDSFIVGFFQALAIIPGISRSGITISTLLFRSIKREEAFKFSFLAAIPLIIASFVFEFWDKSVDFNNLIMLQYSGSFFVAFILGYISLFLLQFVTKKARLNMFGYYCISVSLLLFFLNLGR